MRVVLQRVSFARVTIDGRVTGQIGRGLLILQGIEASDTAADGEWLAQKITKLRIFPDEAGQMNRSVADIAGEILLVSQFTLHASTAKGTRPGFSTAAPPEKSRELFDGLVVLARQAHPQVGAGQFGADMQVSLTNAGPVTFWLEV